MRRTILTLVVLLCGCGDPPDFPEALPDGAEVDTCGPPKLPWSVEFINEPKCASGMKCLGACPISGFETGQATWCCKL